MLQLKNKILSETTRKKRRRKNKKKHLCLINGANQIFIDVFCMLVRLPRVNAAQYKQHQWGLSLCMSLNERDSERKREIKCEGEKWIYASQKRRGCGSGKGRERKAKFGAGGKPNVCFSVLSLQTLEVFHF